MRLTRNESSILTRQLFLLQILRIHVKNSFWVDPAELLYSPTAYFVPFVQLYLLFDILT